jgi:hypothetical protein
MIKWFYNMLIAADSDPQARLFYHSALFVSAVSSWVFALWALGWFVTPAFGTGFARAEQVDSIYVSLLEEQLVDARIRQCQSTSASAKQFFLTRLQEKEREYETRTKRGYTRPACTEVLDGPT